MDDLDRSLAEVWQLSLSDCCEAAVTVRVREPEFGDFFVQNQGVQRVAGEFFSNAADDLNFGYDGDFEFRVNNRDCGESLV
jgi:hypothetical protein